MSIFRYPGGKTKLARVISAAASGKKYFAEPFVGGGSVFLHVLKHTDAHVLINDKDPLIFAFWSVVFGHSPDDFDALVERIRSTDITIETFNTLRSTTPESTVDMAYYALFFNRTTFSGIRTSGPIGGYAQGGKYTVDCRFNTERIIAEMKSLRADYRRVSVTGLDFADFIKTVPHDDCLIYADPPYYVKGPQLYPETMDDADHERLATSLHGRRFLLSYDAHPFIAALYEDWADIRDVALTYTMTGTGRKNNKVTEYLISSRDVQQ